MNSILVLKSSILGENSQTNQLADYVIQQLAGKHIVIRDLGQNPLPYFDAEAAIAVRGEAKTDLQKNLLTLSDQLVTEIKNADTIIIGAPMYNLSIPSQLKSYFDFICRPRVTFQYTDKGAEGLMTGKKAIILCAFGGIYDESNHITQYLKSILSFIGIHDVQFVYAQGIGLGTEMISAAQNKAKANIDSIIHKL
ncbi:FMN-dependent NADH-azoreductase [Rodentibacter caecimuris]|uniref:FMN dependent NADH:quinone oxidoreductase n=1 Tax=Rodentibacter caecimuris TaxID=1796644 RepID=A0ABX3KWP1_9PAST|nr:FMN-dependent NADH-azoreductase [Rodentibacter heylii]